MGSRKCNFIQDNRGEIITICGKERILTCGVQGCSRIQEYLCDWPKCNADLCEKHACDHPYINDVHYCPEHWDKKEVQDEIKRMDKKSEDKRREKNQLNIFGSEVI